MSIQGLVERAPRLPIIHVALLLLCIFTVQPATRAVAAPLVEGPSFSCAAPNQLESVICSDPLLAAKDRTLAQLYAAARIDVFGLGPSQEQDVQRAWLKTINKQCGQQSAKACLNDAYDDRLTALAVAALFRTPDQALQLLHRTAPKSAPIYEAIYRYATTSDTDERRRTVAGLIGPAFDDLKAQGANWPTFMALKNAVAAASDDAAFGAFLDEASVSDYELTLPCSALLRRPALIAALGSQFGGAIDGDIMSSDCDVTTPRLASFDELTNAATAAQPFCEGTIRFSTGRDYAELLDAIRLHHVDHWKSGAEEPPAGQDRAEKRFERSRGMLEANAKEELARYYLQVFNVAPGLAETQAIGAIDAAIDAAFNQCD